MEKIREAYLAGWRNKLVHVSEKPAEDHVRQDESENEAESSVTVSHGSRSVDNSGSAADNVSIQMSERSKEDVEKQRCLAAFRE